jgi:hypothetical protein
LENFDDEWDVDDAIRAELIEADRAADRLNACPDVEAVMDSQEDE